MGRRTGGPTVSLKEHFDALRAADQRALAIKEAADQRALDLAREIQVYKDEKANALRAQIEGERGEYARKTDLAALQERFEASIQALAYRYETAHKPIADYVTAQIARRGGIGLSWNAATVLIAVVGVLIAAYVATH